MAVDRQTIKSFSSSKVCVVTCIKSKITSLVWNAIPVGNKISSYGSRYAIQLRLDIMISKI